MAKTKPAPPPDDEAPTPRRFLRIPRMGDVIKIIALSAVVGLAMRWLGLSPQDVWTRAWSFVTDRVGDMGGIATTIWEYGRDFVIAGALVVVPLWVIVRTLSALAGKRKRP